MVMVTLVAVIVIVVVLNRGLVWDAATIDLVVLVEALFIDVLAEVVTALDFLVTASYFGDVLSGMVVGALADVITGFVYANVNVFTSLMTALEFGLPKPLGEFSC